PRRHSRSRPRRRRELVPTTSSHGSTRRARDTQRAPSRGRCLALRVLRALAGLVTPVLLALDLARIARDEAGLLERRAVLRVDLQERSGDAVAYRDGLGAHATTAHVDVGPVVARRGGNLERLANDHARRLATEVLVRGAVVDGDLTPSSAQPDTRHGGLALAGTREDVGVCTHGVANPQTRGTGFCARCGWSGPA